MDIRVQRPARALQRRDHAGLPTGDAARARAAPVDVAQHPRVHPQHRAAQPVIPRHLVAQPIWHRQDPLPHRRPRQHRVHQGRRPLRHPPAPAARTPPAPLARKRHQVLARAALALKARHTGLVHPAQQELPELALHELRQARAVARLRHRAQEGLQMLGDDLVEHGVLGVSRAIHRRDTSHPSEWRARAALPMPRDGYADSGRRRRPHAPPLEPPPERARDPPLRRLIVNIRDPLDAPPRLAGRREI